MAPIRDDYAAQRAQNSIEELTARAARLVPVDGSAEPMDGLLVFRESAPTEVRYGMCFPSFCVIAQGSKEVRLGDRRYRYDPAHYLIASMTLPYATRIIDASPDRPYLGVVVTLDPSLIGSLMVEDERLSPRPPAAMTAIDVSHLDVDLLDAVVRLVRLLDTPDDVRALAPIISREIVYRLLTGEQGDRLRHVVATGGQTNRIAEAIIRLRKELERPLRIEEFARDLGMSVSGFHHHFKAVTAMSPLQFQKQLRLQEARKLMLGDRLDATNAASRVGYVDPSQFSREYKRLFGEPPMRDVERLRGTALESAGV
ncbi:AraC family transcriptional regulator [soil metagenome]